jgi:hypothetical protein
MSPASYLTAPPRADIVPAGLSRVNGVGEGENSRPCGGLGLIGEDSNAAIAVLAAEFLYFPRDGGGRGLRVVEHQELGGGGVDAVGLNGQVVVIAADKRHSLKMRKEK